MRVNDFLAQSILDNFPSPESEGQRAIQVLLKKNLDMPLDAIEVLLKIARNSLPSAPKVGDCWVNLELTGSVGGHSYQLHEDEYGRFWLLNITTMAHHWGGAQGLEDITLMVENTNSWKPVERSVKSTSTHSMISNGYNKIKPLF